MIFPRNKTFVKEWELHSLEEHKTMIEMLRNHDFNSAADISGTCIGHFPYRNALSVNIILPST